MYIFSSYRFLLFPYQDHAFSPAFAVHPCHSPIFCQQGDESSTGSQPAPFIPACACTCTGLLTCILHLPKYGHKATITGFFRYTRISPLQGRMHCLVFPFPFQLPHLKVSSGLFPRRGRLLLHPEVPYILMQTLLRQPLPLTVSVFPGPFTQNQAGLLPRYPWIN